jgi:hypothetical protein
MRICPLCDQVAIIEPAVRKTKVLVEPRNPDSGELEVNLHYLFCRSCSSEFATGKEIDLNCLLVRKARHDAKL